MRVRTRVHRHSFTDSRVHAVALVALSRPPLLRRLYALSLLDKQKDWMPKEEAGVERVEGTNWARICLLLVNAPALRQVSCRGSFGEISYDGRGIAQPTALLLRSSLGITHLVLKCTRLAGNGVRLLCSALRSPNARRLAYLKLEKVVAVRTGGTGDSLGAGDALASLLRDPRCRLVDLRLSGAQTPAHEGPFDEADDDVGWPHAAVDAVMESAAPVLERLTVPAADDEARVCLNRQLLAAALRAELRAERPGASPCFMSFE